MIGHLGRCTSQGLRTMDGDNRRDRDITRGDVRGKVPWTMSRRGAKKDVEHTRRASKLRSSQKSILRRCDSSGITFHRFPSRSREDGGERTAMRDDRTTHADPTGEKGSARPRTDLASELTLWANFTASPMMLQA